MSAPSVPSPRAKLDSLKIAVEDMKKAVSESERKIKAFRETEEAKKTTSTPKAPRT